MSDFEETYTVREADPLSWLEHAGGMRLSADVVYKALVEIAPVSQTVPGIREKKLAYMQSFMLLTALAFENLLKGIAVVDAPTAWRNLRDDSGHGISAFAAKYINLSSEERDLLRRLQEYLVWAGRYIIPKTPGRFASGFQLLSLRRGDRALISSLFERLSDILRDRAAQRA